MPTGIKPVRLFHIQELFPERFSICVLGPVLIVAPASTQEGSCSSLRTPWVFQCLDLIEGLPHSQSMKAFIAIEIRPKDDRRLRSTFLESRSSRGV